MSEHIQAAIAELEGKLRTQQAEVNQTKQAINILSGIAGMPEPYPNASGDGEPQLTRIQADTFYGKPLNTAIREYLGMRKSQGLGAASVNEIYEALTRGGFRHEAKDDNNAKAVLRDALRKKPDVFHKLPTGDYGLLAWYPAAKAARETVPAEPASKAPEPATPLPRAQTASPKRLGWAQEVDRVLSDARGPLSPQDIVDAIVRTYPGMEMPPSVGPIVRNTLYTKASEMGWARDGKGWIKARKEKADAAAS
jgi:hypothetical protein